MIALIDEAHVFLERSLHDFGTKCDGRWQFGNLKFYIIDLLLLVTLFCPASLLKFTVDRGILTINRMKSFDGRVSSGPISMAYGIKPYLRG